MCLDSPDIPTPQAPPPPPPEPPKEKEQLTPDLIGKDRKRRTDPSIGSLRRDLTRLSTLGGDAGTGLL